MPRSAVLVSFVATAVLSIWSIASAQQRCSGLLGENSFDCRVTDILGINENTPMCIRFSSNGALLNTAFASDTPCACIPSGTPNHAVLSPPTRHFACVGLDLAGSAEGAIDPIAYFGRVSAKGIGAGRIVVDGVTAVFKCTRRKGPCPRY